MPRGGTPEQHSKAGQQSHKNDEDKRKEQRARGPDDDNQRRGGSGNFADDREKASEAGRKGGSR